MFGFLHQLLSQGHLLRVQRLLANLQLPPPGILVSANPAAPAAAVAQTSETLQNLLRSLEEELRSFRKEHRLPTRSLLEDWRLEDEAWELREAVFRESLQELELAHSRHLALQLLVRSSSLHVAGLDQILLSPSTTQEITVGGGDASSHHLSSTGRGWKQRLLSSSSAVEDALILSDPFRLLTPSAATPPRSAESRDGWEESNGLVPSIPGEKRAVQERKLATLRAQRELRRTALLPQTGWDCFHGRFVPPSISLYPLFRYTANRVLLQSQLDGVNCLRKLRKSLLRHPQQQVVVLEEEEQDFGPPEYQEYFSPNEILWRNEYKSIQAACVGVGLLYEARTAVCEVATKLMWLGGARIAGYLLQASMSSVLGLAYLNDVELSSSSSSSSSSASSGVRSEDLLPPPPDMSLSHHPSSDPHEEGPDGATEFAEHQQRLQLQQRQYQYMKVKSRLERRLQKLQPQSRSALGQEEEEEKGGEDQVSVAQSDSIFLTGGEALRIYPAARDSLQKLPVFPLGSSRDCRRASILLLRCFSHFLSEQLLENDTAVRPSSSSSDPVSGGMGEDEMGETKEEETHPSDSVGGGWEDFGDLSEQLEEKGYRLMPGAHRWLKHLQAQAIRHSALPQHPSRVSRPQPSDSDTELSSADGQRIGRSGRQIASGLDIPDPKDRPPLYQIAWERLAQWLEVNPFINVTDAVGVLLGQLLEHGGIRLLLRMADKRGQLREAFHELVTEGVAHLLTNKDIAFLLSHGHSELLLLGSRGGRGGNETKQKRRGGRERESAKDSAPQPHLVLFGLLEPWQQFEVVKYDSFQTVEMLSQYSDLDGQSSPPVCDPGNHFSPSHTHILCFFVSSLLCSLSLSFAGPQMRRRSTAWSA